MTGIEVPTERQTAEVLALREKLAQIEAELQRNNERQNVSEKRFLALAEAASVMIWMSSADGAFVYLNPAWLTFRGRTLAQEAGAGWTQGVHTDDRELCTETFSKAVAARQPFRMQFRVQNAKGEFEWVELAGAPVYGERGEAGYVGSAAQAAAPARSYFTPKEDAVRMVFALTERERQVLVLIAGGKSTKETAAALGISYKTADSHRSRILEKLGVHETASMVRYAIRAGLIEA